MKQSDHVRNHDRFENVVADKHTEAEYSNDCENDTEIVGYLYAHSVAATTPVVKAKIPQRTEVAFHRCCTSLDRDAG